MIFTALFAWDTVAAELTATKADKDPILEQLLANNEKSTLAARDFLLVIVNSGPKEAEYREILHKFLDRVEIQKGKENLLVAERLVANMGYLAASEAFYQEGAAKVLDLLGLGPESFRRVVRDALLAYIEAERKESGQSPTLKKIEEKITQNTPPAQEVLRDAAAIVWKLDGKALLASLVQGLTNNQSRPDDVGGYVLELRGRLRLDFPTLQEWVDWWNENQDKSLQVILAVAQEASEKKRLQLWEKTIQRIKETGRAEQYLESLLDSFSMDPTVELREAVLADLKELPMWLQEIRFGPEVAKEKVLSAAVEFLLRVLEGEASYRYLSLELKTATVAALGGYQTVIEGKEAFRTRVAETLLKDLTKQDPVELSKGDSQSRRYTLELVRTVGALRVASDEIRYFLKKLIGREQGAAAKDAELTTEAVSALGRILTKERNAEAIELLLSVYQTYRGRTEKAWRDLRKACVTALNVPVPDPAIRSAVRELYRGILDDSEDKPVRIPAIIGLGILAKAGDSESEEHLMNVLRRREQFEMSEVNAVIDALAYLGGKKALTCFADFLTAKDSPFAGQIWKKTVSIVKGGEPELFPWLVLELEKRGLEHDTSDYAQVIVRLDKEPSFDGFFSPDKISTESPQSADTFWNSFLSRLRAYVLVGAEIDALSQWQELREFVVRNEKLRQVLPRAKEELDRVKEGLTLKVDVKTALTRRPAPSSAVLQDKLVEIIRTSGNEPLQRWHALYWVRQQVQGLEPSEENRQLVTGLHTTLSGPDESALWKGLPPPVQDNFLKAMNTLGEQLRASVRSEG